MGRDLSGEVVVIHHPNAASGGRVATIPVGTFLTPSNRGPEHQALRHLIGTLLDPQRLSGPDNIVDVKA